MGASHADISKHVKVYMMVFMALAAGTVITVLAANVDFGGHLNVAVALLIATVKASLVALIFMHLKWDRSISIWYPLGLCAIFFAVLLALPVLTTHDTPALTENRSWDVLAREVKPEAKGATHVPGH
jgi:cytochrome c oxidase subunit 4